MMANTKQEKANEEAKERDKIRREKIGGYFLNLSQLTFVALVLGTITPIYTDSNIGINWYVLIAGMALTVILAIIGSKILK